MIYFKPQELACRCGCSRLIIHPGFGEALDELREAFGAPLQPTSGCRCRNYNATIKGHPKSLHICNEPQHEGQQGTLAVDIYTPDGACRGRLFALAWRLGWSIGWNAKKEFLHLDRRDFIGLQQTTFDY